MPESLRVWALPQTVLGTNCWVLAAEESSDAIVIDCGGDADEVLDLVAREGLTVRLLVATHGHADHIGGMADLRARTGAPLAMHADDRLLAETKQYAAVAFLGCVPEPVVVDRTLADGDAIEFGAVTLRVLHLPGHTPGCIGLLGAGHLVSGDVLFAGSIGRTDLPGGDGEAMRASLDRLGALEPATVVLPGHGPETTIALERDVNPWLA